MNHCQCYFLITLVVLSCREGVAYIHRPSKTSVSRSLQLTKICSSNRDQDEEDYVNKLAEAQAAIAAAEEARKRLERGKADVNPSSGLPRKALRSQITRTDAGTLEIRIPPEGMTTNAIFSAAFSLIWFSSILPVSLSAGAGLFMIPFWFVGGLVAKTAVIDPFIGLLLTVGQYGYTLESQYFGKTIRKEEGATEELRGASMQVVAHVNGHPQCELKLFSEKGVTSLGIGTTVLPEEMQFIADEINTFLNARSDLPDLMKPPQRALDDASQ